MSQVLWHVVRVLFRKIRLFFERKRRSDDRLDELDLYAMIQLEVRAQIEDSVDMDRDVFLYRQEIFECLAAAERMGDYEDFVFTVVLLVHIGDEL